jgi:carbamoyltransferase
VKVLGISGSERHAAAAVTVDGRVVAAATEDVLARVCDIGYRSAGGWPRASVDACFRAAGVTANDIDKLVVVDDHGEPDGAGRLAVPASVRASRMAIDPCLADARQITAVSDATESLLVVFGFDPGSHAVFQQHDTQLTQLSRPSGADAFTCVLRHVAQALGISSAADVVAMRTDEADGAMVREFEAAVRWEPDGCISVDHNRIAAVLRSLEQLGTSVEDRSLNSDYQYLASSIANALSRRVETLVVEIADAMRTRARVASVGFGGALFAVPAIAAGVLSEFGADAAMAPVPEPSGRAIGAALECDGMHPERLRTLNLGPAFSEQEIKNTLDNCRLSYMYEPDRVRLLTRASRLLAGGMLVGWFHGPIGFGPRSVSTRAILCDPSSRWARENVNRFLRHVPVESPIPLTISASAAWRGVHVRPHLLHHVTMPRDWHSRITAVLDPRGAAPLHVIGDTEPAVLADLLRLHEERTGVPGLITLPFSGPGEPIVATPRDAIRTMFSSPVEAMIMERFVVVKDQWILTSDAA